MTSPMLLEAVRSTTTAHHNQVEFSDDDLVTGLEHRPIEPFQVNIRSVRRPGVFNAEPVLIDDKPGVMTRHGHVTEKNRDIVRPAGQRCSLAEDIRQPGARAALDDERIAEAPGHSRPCITLFPQDGWFVGDGRIVADPGLVRVLAPGRYSGHDGDGSAFHLKSWLRLGEPGYSFAAA